MARARNHDRAAYIEVVTDKYAASPLAQRLHDSIDTFYGA
jgi:indolepyruvate decarboxylase